jgi:hypothetical protein
VQIIVVDFALLGKSQLAGTRLLPFITGGNEYSKHTQYYESVLMLAKHKPAPPPPKSVATQHRTVHNSSITLHNQSHRKRELTEHHPCSGIEGGRHQPCVGSITYEPTNTST